jgi:hypothetical protein
MENHEVAKGHLLLECPNYITLLMRKSIMIHYEPRERELNPS